MAEQDRTGSHAITCDSPGCGFEVLGMDAADSKESANLLGWTRQEGMDLCPDCGSSPGKVALRLRFGTDQIDAVADRDYVKGEPVYTQSGMALGIAVADAKKGDTFKIELTPPPAQAGQVASTHAKYADLFQPGDPERLEPGAVQQAAMDLDQQFGEGTDQELEQALRGRSGQASDPEAN